MAMTDHDIERWFTYHTPTEGQVVCYQEIRDAAKDFAYLIRRVTPASADQTAAIRKVREAVMTANAAIACADPD